MDSWVFRNELIFAAYKILVVSDSVRLSVKEKSQRRCICDWQPYLAHLSNEQFIGYLIPLFTFIVCGILNKHKNTNFYLWLSDIFVQCPQSWFGGCKQGEVIASIIKCGMKLLINSQTATVQPLKFWNGYVIEIVMSVCCPLRVSPKFYEFSRLVCSDKMVTSSLSYQNGLN